MVLYIRHFFQAIILVFNEIKQSALVLLWEHLSDSEGLAGNPADKWGKICEY